MTQIGRSALDFLVVGAQKSGTTALYEYLRGHPSIALPAGKEAPFFNIDAYYARGLDTFIADHFAPSRTAIARGVISPQYMTSSKITDRVARAVPDARIIAILRDPVDRAISHYKMAVRRRQEIRSVDDAFCSLLDGTRLRVARELPAAPENEPQCYLAWSEYGRILARYADHYPRERIRILFFEDLITEAARTIDNLLEFIGLPPGYRPKNLGQRIFEGSTEERFPEVRQLVKQVFPATLWTVIPQRTQSRLRYLMERLNTRPPRARAALITPSESVVARLTDLFSQDLLELERLFAIEVPWTRYKGLRQSLGRDDKATGAAAR